MATIHPKGERFSLTDRKGRKIRGVFDKAQTTEGERFILFVHGFSEHTGAYEEFSETLSSKTSHTIRFDFPGFGESEGLRSYVDDFEEYAETMDLIWRRFNLDESAVPVFIVCHSMGAMITLLWLDKKIKRVNGIVMIAPYFDLPLFAKYLYRPLSKTLSTVAKTFPALTRVPFEKLSTRKVAAASYTNDPLRGRQITAGFSEAMFKKLPLGDCVQTLPDCPVLMFLTSTDQIVSAFSSASLFKKLPNRDKRLIALTQSAHDILKDKHRLYTIKTGEDWIVRRS